MLDSRRRRGSGHLVIMAKPGRHSAPSQGGSHCAATSPPGCVDFPANAIVRVAAHGLPSPGMTVPHPHFAFLCLSEADTFALCEIASSKLYQLGTYPAREARELAEALFPELPRLELEAQPGVVDGKILLTLATLAWECYQQRPDKMHPVGGGRERADKWRFGLFLPRLPMHRKSPASENATCGAK